MHGKRTLGNHVPVNCYIFHLLLNLWKHFASISWFYTVNVPTVLVNWFFFYHSLYLPAICLSGLHEYSLKPYSLQQHFVLNFNQECFSYLFRESSIGFAVYGWVKLLGVRLTADRNFLLWLTVERVHAFAVFTEKY